MMYFQDDNKGTPVRVDLDPYHVAVYGTLRKGQPANGLLEGCPCVGTTLVYGYQMVTWGPYPYAIRDSHHWSVVAEVYRVTSDAAFKGLDRLEGYPHHYDRDLVNTPFGLAWMYCVDKTDLNLAGTTCIPSGNWLDYSRVPHGKGESDTDFQVELK